MLFSLTVKAYSFTKIQGKNFVERDRNKYNKRHIWCGYLEELYYFYINNCDKLALNYFEKYRIYSLFFGYFIPLYSCYILVSIVFYLQHQFENTYWMAAIWGQ